MRKVFVATAIVAGMMAAPVTASADDASDNAAVLAITTTMASILGDTPDAFREWCEDGEFRQSGPVYECHNRGVAFFARWSTKPAFVQFLGPYDGYVAFRRALIRTHGEPDRTRDVTDTWYIGAFALSIDTHDLKTRVTLIRRKEGDK